MEYNKQYVKCRNVGSITAGSQPDLWGGCGWKFVSFSVAQLMVTIGYFELRSYQVTDINNKYSNEQYYSFKILSCLTMLVVSVIYVFSKGYSFDRIILILLLCVLKMLDAYEEYYVTLYQKENQLDIGAKYSSIRLFATILAFLILVILTQNMYIASAGAIIAAVIIIWIWFEVKAKEIFQYLCQEI